MTDDTRVNRQVVVRGTPESAFAAFTERFDAIKPREHNLLGSPIVETLFEPRVGGRIVDRGQDGSECAWSRVLVFEPPHRIVFTWDIGPMWQLENDANNASEVEVRFVPDGPEHTRVELEHRFLDRHGPGWRSLHDGVGDDQGWSLYLARYAALLEPA
ncbi:SRPBCC family protein [Aeromicrobium sp.]|uniref:SRPBCC family protein n=1 Tax=Aeromicrobium sp. TaxID=1871063 RepID=UPI0030BC30C6